MIQTVKDGLFRYLLPSNTEANFSFSVADNNFNLHGSVTVIDRKATITVDRNKITKKELGYLWREANKFFKKWKIANNLKDKQVMLVSKEPTQDGILPMLRLYGLYRFSIDAKKRK